MRIAYITTYDATDVNSWSGLGYFILRSLRGAGHDVDLVGPLEPPGRLVMLRRTYHRYLTRRDYLWPRAPRVARAVATAAMKELARKRYDVVFAPDTIPVAYLGGSWPVATWTDATFASMLDFYPGFSTARLARESLIDGMRLEQAALTRSSASIFASDWAAQSALDDFGAAEAKVHVVPFGANLEGAPDARDVDHTIGQRPDHRCSLLFVGIDWVRKGGDRALEVVEGLNDAGLPSRLTIVGSSPRVPERLLPWVDVLGHVDKSAGGGEVIARLMQSSHFLLHPTQAECFGLVLCEANAFGVPALSTVVGGVPTIVRSGANGQLFDAGAPAAHYVEYILELFRSFDRYQDLARRARIEFEERLNWTVAGERVSSLLQSL